MRGSTHGYSKSKFRNDAPCSVVTKTQLKVNKKEARRTEHPQSVFKSHFGLDLNIPLTWLHALALKYWLRGRNRKVNPQVLVYLL